MSTYEVLALLILFGTFLVALPYAEIMSSRIGARYMRRCSRSIIWIACGSGSRSFMAT